VSFWSELRDRRVVGSGIGYLVAALAVAEGADILLPQVGAPEWAFRAILATLVVGFPVALVLAWIYDITPDGIRRFGDRPGDGGLPVPGSPRSDSSGAAAQGGADPDERGLKIPRRDDRPSVAVLPFTNMSGDPGNDHFCDGMTEDILTHLARIQGLRVPSRTSVMRYKGTGLSLPEVANEMGVGSVLEGSVRVVNGRVRVTVQLIDAAEDAHIWADSFDRSLEDVFGVQSEVAESVAEALSTELSVAELEEIRARPTDDIRAYSLCLLGEEALATWTPADLDRAVEHFESALKLDPDYTRAYAGLILVLTVRPMFSGRTPADHYSRVNRVVAEAPELDRDVALVHAAYATLLWSRDHDWVGAREEIEQAMTLEPKNTFVRCLKAFLLVIEEDFDGALDVLESAEAGPREMIFVEGVKATAYTMSGRAAEALAAVEGALRVFPDTPGLLFQRSLALHGLDRPAEALDAIDAALRLDPQMGLAAAVRVFLLAVLGRGQEAEAEAGRLDRWGGEDPVGGYALGLARMALGDVDAAMEMWEQAVRERDFSVPFLRASTRFRPLRAHPRFQAILQSMWPGHGEFPVEPGRRPS
jgi:TolB-like protein/Flp pilus assembly protein TadD